MHVEVWCERERLRNAAVAAREEATAAAVWHESARCDEEAAAQAAREAKAARDEAREAFDEWERRSYNRGKKRLKDKMKALQGELKPLCPPPQLEPA